MRVKVNLREFNGEVKVLSATEEAIITNASGSSQENFSVLMDEFKDPKLKKVSIHPQQSNGLEFETEVDGGWVIIFRQDNIYGDGSLMKVTRYNKNDQQRNKEYLTKDGKWLPKKGLGDLPRNAIRIPLFAPEKK